jgi:3'(2'), 5'-bisphosphate nucleotidase
MDIKIDIDPILNIAIEAGKAILKVYTDPEQDFSITLKDDASPLTIADKISNDIICNGLRKLHPDIPIISEEEKNIAYETRKDWEYFWCVDPLDGTKEFIKKNGEFTVNIALIHKQTPVLGIIYIPVTELLYFADSATGSWKQIAGEAPISIKADKKEVGWTAVGSRSHSDADEDALLSRYPVVDFIAVGSSIKFCMIAEGKAQIYFRKGPTMEWDTAAGQAIVTYAGCTVETLTGEPLPYNKPSLLNSSFLCKIK